VSEPLTLTGHRPITPGRGLRGLPLTPPGFPLGTDYLGQDVLSRILDGGHDLLVLPLIATALATAVGVLTGIIIGYLGGRLDATVTRLIDVLLAIPALLVLLVIVSGWGSGRTVLVTAVAFTGWPFIVRCPPMRW
jgi:peptide/nickel transport system permease protein